MIQAAEEVTQQPIKTILQERRAGDPAKLVACNQKAQDILGWKPKYTDIKEIIRTAWNFHKNH